MQIENFSLSRLTPPLDETLVPHPTGGGERERGGDNIFHFSVRPAGHNMRAAVRGPHYIAHFWTLRGPHFMASRATFGPRAALFTSLD